MKAKTRSKAFFFIFLLLAAGFLTTCSNAIEPTLTGEGISMNRRSARTQILSEMSERDCLEFIVSNGVPIPEEYADIPELGAFVKSIIHEAVIPGA